MQVKLEEQKTKLLLSSFSERKSTFTPPMLLNILYQWPTYVDIIIFITIMVVCMRWGHRMKKKKVKQDPLFKPEEGSAIEGSLLGLLALLLAFTFSMAAERFEERRKVVIEEANDIASAIHNADLYSDGVKKEIRNYLQQYVEARIDYFEARRDQEKIAAALIKTSSLQDKLFSVAIDDARNKEVLTRAQLMMPVLQAMDENVSVRENLRLATVPVLVYLLLLLLCFTASFMVGYKQPEKKLDRIMMWIFIVMTSLAIYLIVDLDRPRSGLITNYQANQAVYELRNMFTEH
jgi:hypothetical protein